MDIYLLDGYPEDGERPLTRKPFDWITTKSTLMLRVWDC